MVNGFFLRLSLSNSIYGPIAARLSFKPMTTRVERSSLVFHLQSPKLLQIAYWLHQFSHMVLGLVTYTAPDPLERTEPGWLGCTPICSYGTGSPMIVSDELWSHHYHMKKIMKTNRYPAVSTSGYSFPTIWRFPKIGMPPVLIHL